MTCMEIPNSVRRFPCYLKCLVSLKKTGFKRGTILASYWVKHGSQVPWTFKESTDDMHVKNLLKQLELQVSQDTSHVERHARKKDPSIRNLTLIKWTSEGETHRLNIVRSIAPKWREAGILLGIAPTEVEIISKRYPNEPVDCCREAFNKWLEGGGSQTDYKTTWSGVIELLEDLLYGQVAKNLTTALEANEIYVVRK